MPEMPSELEALARKMKELKEEKKGLEEKVKIANEEIKHVSERMVEIFDEQGISLIKFPELGVFYIQGNSYPSIESEAQFFEWLKANGHGDLIKATVHPQTLRAFVKTFLEEGKAIPPGVTPGHLLREIRVRAG